MTNNKMKFELLSVKEQVQLSTSWYRLAEPIYVIDYSKYIDGLETETEAENKAFVYWETTKGIQFQDDRSRMAYENNILILAQIA